MPLKITRCLLIACLLCLPVIETLAKCDDWANLQKFEDVSVRDAVRDRFGNLYAVGGFFNTNFTIGGTTIPYLGGHTIFVLKFDKNLNLLWGKSFGNGNNCSATDVAIDHEDNLIVAGYYFEAIDFDCNHLESAGRFDTFVAKFLSDGTVQWVKHSTGTNDEEPRGLVITKDNGVIVVGDFVEGSGFFEGVPVQSFGGLDSFIVKLDRNGNVEWASSVGGTGGNRPDYILDVDVDSNDNVVITGFFESDELFIGSLTVDGKTISENFFVAKLNSLGQPLWAKGTGNDVDVSGWSLKVDPDDNIYVIGRFYDGTITIDGFSLTSSGNADVMLIKYSPDGDALAATNFGGTEFDTGMSLDIDPDGNPVAVGFYHSTSFHVGPFTETKTDQTSDTFVIRFDSELAAICISKISGTSEAHVWRMDVDRAGNIWLVVDNDLGVGQFVFDTEYMVDGNAPSSMIVSIGDLDTFDTGSQTSIFDIELGDGKDLCSGEDVVLDAGSWCNALITWQDGSHDRFFNVLNPGQYWVEVVSNGLIARDTIAFFAPFPQTLDIGKDTTLCVGQSLLLNAGDHCGLTYEWQNGSTSSTFLVTQPGTYTVIIKNGADAITDAVNVSYLPPPQVNLGVDKDICDGDVVAFDVGQTVPSKYLWSDGSSLPTFTSSEEGIFWVKVETRCQVDYDTIKIRKPGPIAADLGEDRTVCAGNAVVLGGEVANATSYLWQDGTVESTLRVTQSGTFEVVISNGCDQASDNVAVTVVDQDDMPVPNVITPNDDNANDKFVLPEAMIGSQLLIYNRWGEDVYVSDNYQNTWTGDGESSGVYFYTLYGVCPSPIKGTIHLLRN